MCALRYALAPLRPCPLRRGGRSWLESLESAESAYCRAEAEWERQRRLSDDGIASRDQAETSREAWEQARIEFERRRDALQLVREGRIQGRGRAMESVIRAPAAGIVLSLRASS